jgi:hypothetical protein
MLEIKNTVTNQMPVAYNSSYSGGRNQEDSSSKPDGANCLRDFISKIPNMKKD